MVVVVAVAGRVVVVAVLAVVVGRTAATEIPMEAVGWAMVVVVGAVVAVGGAAARAAACPGRRCGGRPRSCTCRLSQRAEHGP